MLKDLTYRGQKLPTTSIEDSNPPPTESLKSNSLRSGRIVNSLLLLLSVSIISIIFIYLKTFKFDPVNLKMEDVVPNLEVEKSTISNTKEDSQLSLSFDSIRPSNKESCVELPIYDKVQHIVSPPKGPVTIVCCNSTVGKLAIAVHPSWAPNGAKRFLDLVSTGFFSSKIGLFRALKGFLVQFGLAGDPAVQQQWNEKDWLPDDTPWLPQGPPGREINGVKRFKRGYLAYAGAGKNSRGTQLILAFNDHGWLGGAFWEVPFGHLIGEESYAVMDRIYTGYGEAPSQGKIQNRGVSYLESEFPKLDYITSCEIVAENVPWEVGKTG